MDRFYNLIEELAAQLDVELHADHRNICSFVVDEKIQIQLELDTGGDHLLVCAAICEVPAGKYRENLFKECLKHNALFPPRYGVLSYSERQNQLVLYDRLILSELHSLDLIDYLNIFVPKAITWKEAVERGQPLPTMVEYPVLEKIRGGF